MSAPETISSALHSLAHATLDRWFARIGIDVDGIIQNGAGSVIDPPLLRGEAAICYSEFWGADLAHLGTASRISPAVARRCEDAHLLAVARGTFRPVIHPSTESTTTQRQIAAALACGLVAQLAPPHVDGGEVAIWSDTDTPTNDGDDHAYRIRAGGGREITIFETADDAAIVIWEIWTADPGAARDARIDRAFYG